jgi:hypothetical protein
VVKLSNEDSQPVTFPVCPVKLRVAPLLPAHTVAEALTDPPELAGVTVIVTEEELTEAEPPFWTTAL